MANNTESIMKEKLEALRNAHKSGSAKDLAKARTELDKAIKGVNETRQILAFEECAAEENPYSAFAIKTFFTSAHLKETKDSNGDVSGYEIEDRPSRMNFKQFVKHCELDASIIADIGLLHDLLHTRKQEIYSFTSDDRKKYGDFFCYVVSEKQKGKTPDSNRQLCLKLQEIIDKCGVEAKIINRDVQWCMDCAFVQDMKKNCTMVRVTDGKFMAVVLDDIKHLVDGTPFSVLKKRSDSTDSEKPETTSESDSESENDSESEEAVA